MQTLVKDIRYALRLLRRSPGFTLVALLSLGLGIGANTAIFSLVNVVILRPMPVEDAEALVAVYQTDERNPGNIPVSDLNFQDLRDQNTVLDGLATVTFGQVNYLAEGGASSQQPIQLVSGDYFDVMGVSLELGRGFRPEEDDALGAFPVAVLSWPFWQREFGGAPDVLGRTVTLNRMPFSVIGVAPRTFTGTFPVAAPAAWVPTAMHEVVQPELTWYEQRRGLFMFPVGRLKPDATVEQARSNLQAIMANLEREFPVDNAGRSVAVRPLLEARIDPNGDGQLLTLSRLLMATVGIVLLIACANIANLLLARASGRRRELSVRLAIGADRWRIVRQLLTEAVLLSVVGGTFGIVLASWLLRLLAANPNVLPIPVEEIGVLDPRVLSFTVGVSVVTGLVFGLAPALEASRADVVSAIKQDSLPGGEGRAWLRRTLVAAQVALSVVSLVAAGVFLRSLSHTARIEPGFATDTVATLAVNLGREGYDAKRGTVFYRDLIERASALPGARAAAYAQNVPLGGGTFMRSVYLDTADTTEQDRRLVQVNYISPRFFETTQIPLLRGRDFDSRDTTDAPSVAIVNEAMAAQFWPGQEALGQRFRFFGEETPTEVVGIARDSKVAGLAEDPPVAVAYEPVYQDYQPFGSLLVRTEGPAANLTSSLRQAVSELDPGLTVLNVATLADQVRQSMTGQQTITAVVGLLGGVALLLASMGLYGVASYWVGQRTREIGVRMALGARPAGMLALVLRQSLVVVGVGLGIGLGIAILVGLALEAQVGAMLVEVSPTDPLTLLFTATVLCIVALVAAFVPARRAARIDPVIALRQD